MKIKIYVAGPYTKPSPETNVRRAVEMADNLLAAGFIPFIPHLTHLWHTLSPKPYKEWTDWDNEWVSVCDALLRLPGESPGADAEEILAQSLGLPVFHSLAEAIAWYDGR